MKNNRGFLLAESLVVSTFVLTVLIVLFIQFSNLTNNYKNSYNYNNVESIYNLGAVDKYIQNNQTDPLATYLNNVETPYLVIYDDAGCNQDIGLTDITFCENVVSEAGIKFLIYTSSEIDEIQKYVKTKKDDNLTQDFRDFISRVEAVTVKNKGRLFAQFTDGTYSTVVIDKTTKIYDSENEIRPTFTKSVDASGKVTVHIAYPYGCGTKYTCSYQKNGTKETVTVATNTNNIVDVDFTKNGTLIATVSDGQKDVTNTYEITDLIPTNKLLFWGQAGNSSNTSTLLKDKSGNNDGKIVGATFKDNTLEFDGVDDYVNLGYANYDFNNGISYVIYVKIASSSFRDFFGNWDAAGGGLTYINDNGIIGFYQYDGSTYISASSEKNTVMGDTYYTLVGVLGDNELRIYVDGVLKGTTTIKGTTKSKAPIFIGGNPSADGKLEWGAKISVKEAMVYERALSDSEVKFITDNFKERYK